MISQLTVFLANEKGRLAAACRTLADADINMKALFIADTADFGIVRIFCDTPKRAVEVLGQAGFRASLTPVIAVSVEDAPGTLADLLGFCQGASMNIEYGYCFCTADGKAVDVLKIDMRFLDRDDRRSKDIMESVIRMARWLDLPVIAEGVETREQVNFLLDVGCSYAQGYYYARPMEAAAFEALLTDGSKVQHEQCALQDARRPILDFRDLLHENTISDRMLSSIIGSVALYSYADGDLRLIRGNEAYRRLIATLGEGVNGAEEGGSLLPFVHDEDRDALVAAAEETVRSCPDDGVEVVVRRMGTNGCHWHKMRLFHLNTTNGSATVYGSVTDVTERMEYMEALRKSEQRFEMTLEASGTVVFELDIPTRTARYSEFLQQAFGLAETVANAPEGFIEQGTVAEESIEDFRAIYRDLYAGAPRTSAVVRAIMGDGSRAWNRVTLLAMPNEAGAPVKAVGLVENVTRETEMDLLLKRLGRFEQD